MSLDLEFNRLPGNEAFQRRSILIGPSDELRSRLASMPQTLERVESAIMFAGQSSKQSELWRVAAFLRAALAEYCSVEEVQKIDQPNKGPCFAVRTSTNPLLHVLKLMRHLNIHVKSVEVRPHTVGVALEGVDFGLKTFIVSNLSVEDLASLRDGRHYRRSDLGRCVDWFEARQTEWGAGDLICMGTTILATQVCEHFGL
jgi:hypothetical protein